jgi:hypothetical protein
MQKIFEGVTRITTRIEFDLLMNHIDSLIREATKGGHFSDPNESNEYTREIARLGKIGALYEDEFLNLSIKRINEIILPPRPREITRKRTAELVFAT